MSETDPSPAENTQAALQLVLADCDRQGWGLEEIAGRMKSAAEIFERAESRGYSEVLLLVLQSMLKLPTVHRSLTSA